MASDNVFLDPADGAAHDWLELYNPNFAIVDLSGDYLSDKLTDKTQWQIPPGTVLPPNGFLLVWEDGAVQQLRTAAMSATLTAAGLVSPCRSACLAGEGSMVIRTIWLCTFLPPA